MHWLDRCGIIYRIYTSALHSVRVKYLVEGHHSHVLHAILDGEASHISTDKGAGAKSTLASSHFFAVTCLS